ncbi:FAD:protein FMN transferase [Acetobacterium sp.]|uniref:FAD:protein FMN transferase n=1 Tax=Acetobacterium sp. TaxID=1872094 RepID=UPI002F3F13EE
MKTKKMIIQISCLVLGLSLVISMFTGCNKGKTITRNDFLLDTFVSITLYGESDEALLDKPFDKIKELNTTLTEIDSQSDLTRIKDNAGVQPVVVSEATYRIIEKGINYSKISGGYFDATAGPLIDLWGIHAPEIKEAPSPELIAAAQQKIDYKKVVLDPDKKTVYLPEPGMSINIGSVSKGYIADAVMAVIKEEGVKHAIVNLGGNVLVMGGKEDGSPFGVGVEDPNDPGKGYIGVLSIKDGSIVTSGDYQRYFTDAAGKRYHHILDPFTGYPSDSGLTQVTAVTDASVDGDGLTTTLFLLGLDKGLALVEKMPGVEAIFVTKDNKIFVTKGLKDTFVFDKEKYGSKYTVTMME